MEARKSKYFVISVGSNGWDLHIECPRLEQVIADTIKILQGKRIDPLILENIVQELDRRFVAEFLSIKP
jgi:hypothetical protein